MPRPCPLNIAKASDRQNAPLDFTHCPLRDVARAQQATESVMQGQDTPVRPQIGNDHSMSRIDLPQNFRTMSTGRASRRAPPSRMYVFSFPIPLQKCSVPQLRTQLHRSLQVFRRK